MRRGGKVNKKGRARHFTSPEEIERQNREDRKAWRSKKDESEEEEEGEDEASKSGSSDSEESSGSDSGSAKKDAAAGAKVTNPNHEVKKTKKIDQLGLDEKPEPSRREREELEKQRAREHYQLLHAQGKTEEARADLARLAIIRQQREEAARKREEEKKLKEAAAAAKTASIHKALGKRT